MACHVKLMGDGSPMYAEYHGQVGRFNTRADGTTDFWDPGPWDNEPDKIQWVDEKTGLDCLAVRNQLGNWCGYVGVPRWHPDYGKHYDSVRAHTHGGLTYSDKCHEHPDPGVGVCHVPFGKRPHDIWWLGFDCAHCFDLIPGITSIRRFGCSGLPSSDQYRDVDFVTSYVTVLAEQLKSHNWFTEIRDRIRERLMPRVDW